MAKLLTEEEYAALVADAERYHWLRNNARIEERDGGYSKAYCLPYIKKEIAYLKEPVYHDDFDSAIDKARGVK